uniref:Glycosyltransferase n=1 Tax=Heterorhabditis bacteriophora TaxID=37862 RepID=A0A1I7X547_HETBA
MLIQMIPTVSKLFCRAMAGLNVACFLGIAALFCMNLINDKILASGRMRKYDKGYAQ